MFAFLDGKKVKIAGTTKLLAGLAYAAAEVFAVVTQCLDGTLDLSACYQRLPMTAAAFYVAADGLADLGLGHKMEKLKALLPKKK